MENRIQCDTFPAEDGHIESILIGADSLKVSFQTWNSRKLFLIYEEIGEVVSCNAVYGDIDKYQVIDLEEGRKRHLFYSSWWGEEKVVLSINAKDVKIFQVGSDGGNNSALFDVGYEYIGEQDVFEYIEIK